jgi:hypothetical protein
LALLTINTVDIDGEGDMNSDGLPRHISRIRETGTDDGGDTLAGGREPDGRN